MDGFDCALELGNTILHGLLEKIVDISEYETSLKHELPCHDDQKKNLNLSVPVQVEILPNGHKIHALEFPSPKSLFNQFFQSKSLDAFIAQP